MAYIANYGTIPLFQGNISDITEIGRSHVEFEIKDRREKLNIPMPSNVFQPSCRWALYSAGCTLIEANFMVNGTISASPTSSQLQLYIDGPTNPSGYFNQGKLTFTSGANNGTSISVRAHILGAPNVILLFQSLPYLPAPGDTCQLVPGCDKTLSTCDQKFNNKRNHGGFEWIPCPETAV